MQDLRLKTLRLHKYYNKYFDKLIVNNHEITKVTDFSKDVSKNTCFVNLKDSTDDKYINEAIKLGAKTIITSLNFNKEIKEKINIIKVESPKVELARLLKCLYFNKYHKMPITIGVSGTCGKTTVTSLLYETLKNLNKDVLLIGSNGVKSFYGLKETSFITSNTTPSITKIYKYLCVGLFSLVLFNNSSNDKIVITLIFPIFTISFFVNINDIVSSVESISTLYFCLDCFS